MANTGGAATVGGNMRRERTARNLTLEQIAKRLGLERAAPLSTFERSTHVPKAETIRAYAVAIGCPPATLMAGVLTEHDKLRGSAVPLPPAPAVTTPAAPTIDLTPLAEAMRPLTPEERQQLLGDLLIVLPALMPRRLREGRVAIPLAAGTRRR